MCTSEKDTCVTQRWTCRRRLRIWMQVHSDLTERTVRLCSLWPESFALLNKSWQSVPASHDFFLLSLILPALPVYALEKLQYKNQKEAGWEERRTGVWASPLLAWNHCFHGNGKQRPRGHYQFRGIDCCLLAIFNLNALIGCHACRGIDKAAVFSESQLMSLSFGGRPGNAPLANDSPRLHL